MGRESILFGTAVLIATNLFVKILSLFYRAILVRMIGAEGLGLHEMIMPLYALLIVVASWGIPLAISNISSRELALHKQTRLYSVVKSGGILLAFNSLLLGAAVLFFFPYIKTFAFTDSRVYGGFLALIPSLIVISIVSALRGYFQGTHQTSFIGKSQGVEQVFRVGTGIGIAYYLLGQGRPLGEILIGLAIATFIAESCGGLYLFWKYKRQHKKAAFSPYLAKEMLSIGTPITFSRILITLTFSLQAIIVPKALVLSGHSMGEAAALYGYFSGIAITVLHLPGIITGALAVPLIPAIAEAKSIDNHILMESRIGDSLLFTAIAAWPMLALLFYYATPICRILFASPEAGPMLALLCLGGIFLYLQQPVNAIMQGMNFFSMLLLNIVIANGLYAALLFFSYAQGRFEIETAIYLTILNHALLTVLNMVYLKIRLKIRFHPVKLFVTPLLSACGGLFCLEMIRVYLPGLGREDILSIFLNSIVFLFVYLLVLYLFGGFDKKMFSRFSTRLTRRNNRASS